MKIPTAFIFLFFLFSSLANAQKPILPATRITIAPKIDGKLDDAAWKDLPVVNTPITYSPEYGKPASQKTEVRLGYDDVAIYVGVYMYDSLPRQIKKQLGSRDDVGALADVFTIGLGPYNDGLNGYRLSVSAAGVQSDEKGSPSNQHDASWDAVWQSAVSINNDGWVCEMKIPYSAIRFPSQEIQDWGLQFGRSIATNGELDLWSPVDPKIPGIITQWGTLVGLTNIEPPLRLSFSPYLTAGIQSTPISSDPVDYQTDKILSGGMDVKWGINESFTLDATLIPDFGQVQSDNLVLNISPFETKFNEKRPFFTEGTELFNQDFSNGGGSQLFYSRRIGGTPIHYYDVYDQLGENETLIKNPSDTKLYNATKFSGRTDDGLGIGVLNAVSRPAYAEIKNDETGAVRTVETNPVTNYNVFVLDQTLKNN
ncbi:MAG: carbohydrate binding family 9 domain-containing protein, partial [Chitinophagales bacterium]|nr:carbohydrate binding family 9 domain-containing protein [Chitinophagales bacterium]